MSFLFVFSAKLVKSQFRYVPGKINTPYGVIKTTNMEYSPRFYFSRKKDTLVSWGIFSSGKYDFTLILSNNDSTTVKNAKIDIVDSIFVIKWKKGGEKKMIKPSETKAVFRYADGVKRQGFATDSCWFFLIDSGRICTYSFFSEVINPDLAYFKKGYEGEMMPITISNLTNAMLDNKKALSHLKKNAILKAISVYNKEEKNNSGQPVPN